MKSRRTKRSPKRSLIKWLERRACAPEFAGGLLLLLSIFFFAAATNTLAGWLYVISGVSFALLLMGGVMPARFLKEIKVERSRIEPVSAGDAIAVELIFSNIGKSNKTLWQARDVLPEGISQTQQQQRAIEQLASGKQYRWAYTVDTLRRGIFQFEQVQLITASPFGLFRSLRSRLTPQPAIVYPLVLTLNQCPLIDRIGRDDSNRLHSQEHSHNNATEGLTRTLRPYRWGDPTRLVHWRTSAKFGELRVRELEVTVGGQEVVIALDPSPGWQESDFEEAVVAAASLYFYAQRLNFNVKLWTPASDILHGNRLVLETLAGVEIIPAQAADSDLPDAPLVWITHRRDRLDSLPTGSRWLAWQQSASAVQLSQSPGIVIESSPDDRNSSLRSQLQAMVSSY
jgi:uncharacterized protein (DUF58 family)